jgi:hypothetical protein
MSRFLLVAILFICQCLPATGQKKQAKSPEKPIAKKEMYQKVVFRDTIPLNKRMVYVIDDKKYKEYVKRVKNDSVLVPVATKADWADFKNAHTELRNTFTRNPYGNITAYVDTLTDFQSLNLINGTTVPLDKKLYPSQLSVRQLTFNIRLANSFLNLPMDRPSDVAMFDMVLTNTEALARQMAYTMYFIKSVVIEPPVVFKVYDKNGVLMNDVRCYLVTQNTCRKIACKSCTQTLVSCEIQQVSNIVASKDEVFDCANPTPVKIFLGNYLLFVVKAGTVIYYRDIDINNIELLSNGILALDIKLQ